MGISVTFELSDSDLDHFRELLKRAQIHSSELDHGQIIADARSLINDVRASGASSFVISRVDKLETLLAMIQDGNWEMAAGRRENILQTLAYFTESDDLIPDHIPGLGFLDDAIMIELLVRELEDEIEAYRNFLVERIASIGPVNAP